MSVTSDEAAIASICCCRLLSAFERFVASFVTESWIDLPLKVATFPLWTRDNPSVAVNVNVFTPYVLFPADEPSPHLRSLLRTASGKLAYSLKITASLSSLPHKATLRIDTVDLQVLWKYITVPMKGRGCLYYYYQTHKLHSGHELLTSVHVWRTCTLFFIC